ncbi:thiamine phosphate synthase [Gloeocapsa sp. PCC 73106]|uniref:thiamine phosphate synthase n=1 Tax=Gloeocapsa sp. PCC 73106 TaxID=102232 RepID=UPI0002AB9B0E|nr:thiamine phosphate synthase [Gloeocapsa sp. PCC 73106]ELS00123.1 thiamine-phosphate pyrophosphorylase [Gloeocapsa sp. PCC 73106]
MNSILRILDANLNRAREGLRIIEEWCRFGLDNPDLAQKCKFMRQELASWHVVDLKLSRNTPGDVGTTLSHPLEEQRSDIQGLLQANISRVQEALRVLEEYGKLYDQAMGKSFKQMRYQVYTLESELLGYQQHQRLQKAQLYLVTSPQENLCTIVEQALKGGLSLVQYRSKQGDDLDRLAEVSKLRQLCYQHNALFIINDRLDLAQAVQADGVHLGQKDLPIAVARKILGNQVIIGRSTTNPTEMTKAIAEGADYLGVGPVYNTPTKQGKAATGLEYVRYAVANSPIPWYAIGGIDQGNIQEVIAAGATRVAVVRAIMEAENPTLATQNLLSQINNSTV